MRYASPARGSVLLLWIASCGLKTPARPDLDGGLPPGSTGLPPLSIGAGVGDSCAPGTPCRMGLSCSAGKCSPPAGTTAAGAACQIGPECMSGMCGPTRTCDAPGTGVASDHCGGDADCSQGLRCAFDGTSLFPKCVAQGNKDYGQSCTTTRDCYQGLFCTASKCIAPVFPPGLALPKGIPPYIPSPVATPWPGAMCPAPLMTGTVTARFHVPRPGDPMDGDFYKLPFPNDAARDKMGTVSYANHPHDPSPAVGFDVLKPYLDALSTEPFGNYPTIYFTFDGQFDFASLTAAGDDPQIRLVDLSGAQTDPSWGQRRGLSFVMTDGRNRYICNNYLAIRPGEGEPLKSGGLYAAIVRAGVKTRSDGSLVKADADLIALLGSSPPSDPALADAYAAYAPLRDYLGKAKPTAIDPSQVLNATLFTVGKPPAIAAAMRSSVRAIATGPTVKSMTLCSAGATSPCPQHDGDRNCGAPDPNFDEIHAMVDIPIFQQGSPPYLTSQDGGNIDTSSNVVAPVRTESVCMALTIPKGTPPADGWPVALYAHGTGGSFRGHATDGTAAMLSNVDLGGGTKIGFAVLGIDQIGHGPRRCGGGACTSTASPDDIVFNFVNPQAARFNYVQGAADQHTLVRLVETLAIDATVTGTAIAFNPKKTVYWGHSQGATEGALFLASDSSIGGAVLSGEGGGLVEALTSKTSPIDIKDGLWVALSESSPSAVDVWHPVLSLLQNWVDPSDPIHFAALDGRPALPSGVAAFPRNIFQPSGTSDTYTPFPVQFAYALAAGLTFVDPVLDAKVTTSPSAQGNSTLGALMATTAFRQYMPTGYDGHFVAFRNDQAKIDVTKFLARVAHGDLPKVPE